MKNIAGIIALAIAALIIFLFPLIEVDYLEKTNVPYVTTETCYENEPYEVCDWVEKKVELAHPHKGLPLPPPPGSSPYASDTTVWQKICTTEYRRVEKTREVIRFKDITKTKKVSILKYLWIQGHTFQPIVMAGSSDRTTPPFNVTTKQWVIDWAYLPHPEHPESAIFGFFVYPTGETPLYVDSMLFPEETSGSIHSHAGPGEYYLEVEAANVEHWRIVIRPA